MDLSRGPVEYVLLSSSTVTASINRLIFLALAGITAIEAMGGPQIPWEPGRQDYESEQSAAEHRGDVSNRLPDGALGAAHIRDVFGRMGFSDQEIVALSGAHNLGER